MYQLKSYGLEKYSSAKSKFMGKSKTTKIILIGLFIIVFKPVLLKLKDLISTFFESQEIKDKRSYLEEIRGGIITEDLAYPSYGERMERVRIAYDACEHSGTDEHGLLIVLESGSLTEDLKQLVFDYGIKTTHIFFFDDVTGTLMDHCRAELSGDLLERARALFLKSDIAL